MSGSRPSRSLRCPCCMRFHTLNLAGFRLVTAFAVVLPLLAVPACGKDDSGEVMPSGSGSNSAASGGMGGDAASGGSGGTVTTNSGGSSNDMKLLGPIERDGKLVLEFGETYLEIDPAGGRVTSLRQGATEL